jgi:hypothetical protein
VQQTPSSPLRALAFKVATVVFAVTAFLHPLCPSLQVQSHPQRGPLVFFRVYAGIMSQRASLINTSLTAEGADGKERASKLLQASAANNTYLVRKH